jgi:uncharacterized protein YdeI (BOF family)
MLLNATGIGALPCILLILSGSLHGCSTGKPAVETSISSGVQSRPKPSSISRPKNEIEAASSQRTEEQLEQKQMGLQMGVIIQGDVVRIERDNYFVREKGGEEVRLEIDRTTERMGPIRKGDRIVATVDQHNHAVSIHKVP